MTLPPEKISELKQVIHSHLNQLDIHEHTRNLLSETMRNHGGDNHEDLLKLLKDCGLVEDIMKTFKLNVEDGDTKKTWQSDEQKKFPIDPGKQYLYLQILGGKAFLEHLQDPEVLPGQISSTFTIHLHYNGQRYQSRSVPCACDPTFEDGFLLELRKKSPTKHNVPSLLATTDKIHIVLIKINPSGEAFLIASHYLEWRGILCSPTGRVRNSIELNGVGAESKVPVGILDVRMDLMPKPSEITTADVITTQMSLERSRVAERERLFLAYSKQWWREYLHIRATHAGRLVKIFAQDENSVHRLVCSYVRPLRSGRLLDTPRQAARFVSLFGQLKQPSMSGRQNDMWSTTHCFLARGKGEVVDHCNLLCSLLIGFGLNAYVCVGTKKQNQAHAWVVTIATDETVLFWETLTAQRYKHVAVDPKFPSGAQLPKLDYPYRTVGCIFNNETFYANSQPTDSVHVCSFDLFNQSQWKCMNHQAIQSVCGHTLVPGTLPLVHLLPNMVDPSIKSHQLEEELKTLVFEHRTDLGLLTQWDDELSYLLSPALAAYEFEHSLGVSAANDDFQHAIRRNVPDGHTFKGFPIQFIHTNARRAFATCLKSRTCEDIVCCRGDQVKLAVRVRLFPYPESACAVWIMFAVKYKSVL